MGFSDKLKKIIGDDGELTVEAGNTYEVEFINTFNKKDYFHSYERASNKVSINNENGDE